MLLEKSLYLIFLLVQVSEIDGRPKIEVEYKNETKSFFAEEISSMVLTKMRETAEAYLGHEIKDAVVTVPAVSCFKWDSVPISY